MNSIKSSAEDAKHMLREVRARTSSGSLLGKELLLLLLLLLLHHGRLVLVPLVVGSVVQAETPTNGQAAARETINCPTFMARTAR
jgi:hypothetical protein